MKAIALDLGSSYTKCAVLDLDTFQAQIIDRIPAPRNRARLESRYEIDAEEYGQQAQSLLERAFSLHQDAEALFISTQMHGFVLTDGHCRPMTAYISWQDKASTEGSAMERLRERIPEALMVDSGVPLKQNLSMCNLFGRVCAGWAIPEGAHFHTLGGYLIARLCGRHICHTTNAAPTGMLDSRKRTWNEELIDRLWGKRLVMPQLIDAVEAVGIWRHAGREIAVFPDFGDHQVCVLGSGLRVDEGIHINIGTAGLLARPVGQFETGAFETRPYFDRQYLASISGLPGGRHLDSLATFVQSVFHSFDVQMDRDRIWAYLVHCGGSGHLNVKLGVFANQGSVEGIGPECTLDDVASSVYAAIGSSCGRAIALLGAKNPIVRFSGGAAEKNPALCRAILRALNEDRTPFFHSDDVMRGMLMLFAYASGRYATVAAAQNKVTREMDSQCS